MTTHSFECQKCRLKFSFDSEQSDVVKFQGEFKDGIKCPKCGDVWGAKGSNIMHDFHPAGGGRDMNKIRKANKEASAEAKIAAAKYAAANPEKTVRVERPAGFKSSRYGNQSEVVPESVMQSLKDRAVPKP